MGLIFNDACMLWEAKLRGASFRTTLTIAHLSLCLHPSEVRLFQKAYRRKHPTSSLDALEGYQWGEYSDRFLHTFLDVDALEILDNSAYERATLIHDLNLPVPESLHARFDAVIDAGTLEHVFNFPVALANLMKMVRLGGSIFITTAANNLCGHGFYQFSPEVFFRAFTKENGFNLLRVVFLERRFPIVELVPVRRAYSVKDPAAIRERVGLLSNRPVSMMVEAIKTAHSAPFVAFPQQSDYMAVWDQATRSDHMPQAKRRGLRAVRSHAFRKLPSFLQNWTIGHCCAQMYSFANRSFYQRYKERDPQV
jgi:hypothetical protein